MYLVAMVFFMYILDLPLKIFQMFFQFIESIVQCLSTFMNDINPMMQISQNSFQMFQVGQTFFMLIDQPFSAYIISKKNFQKNILYPLPYLF